jgi:hypothetical protein
VTTSQRSVGPGARPGPINSGSPAGEPHTRVIARPRARPAFVGW